MWGMSKLKEDRSFITAEDCMDHQCKIIDEWDKLNDVTKPTHYQFLSPCKEVKEVINDCNLRVIHEDRDPDFPLDKLYEWDNAIKYILRAPFKNGKQDFEKAQECIRSLLENYE